MLFTFLLLLINVAPVVYPFLISAKDTTSLVLGYSGVFVSVLTTAYLALTPNNALFRGKSVANAFFTAGFAPLKKGEKWLSVGIWSGVFLWYISPMSS